MKRVFRFWKVIVLDILGVLFMILAVLTGWLPGPGGIPLFIIGLSLLAINHEWAKRYVDLAKKYADRLGDFVFVKNSRVQAMYDAGAIAGLIAGVWLLLIHHKLWMVSAGVFLGCLSLLVLLRNRERYKWFKRKR